MVNFALQTRKTSKNYDFFMKNQAKSLIFHGFPCQNLLSAADTLTAGQFAPFGAFLAECQK